MRKDQTANVKTIGDKAANIKTRLDRRKTSQHWATRCISTVLKPMRILQFLVVLLVFVFTIYMIAMDPTPMTSLACIFLIVLSGTYVFVFAVEMISHFAGSALHIIPMSIFSLFGVLFFGVAGILLICNGYTRLVMPIATIVSCLLAALLFLIDITMVLSFWKRRCSICKRCCNNDGTEFLLHKEEEPLVEDATKIMKHDVTTSLSDVRVLPELQGIATTLPEHCYRKVEYPHRRQYVDCHTCVPSFCNLDVAQIQTDPRKVSVVESQTPSAITKEKPIQTLSKCELCQQQIAKIPFTSPVIEAAVAASGGQCFQHPQMTYPAIVQFVRGGVNAPCCSGCKCITSQQQEHHQQSQSLPSERAGSLTRTLKSNPNKTLTSETTQQVTNPDITRLTRGVGQTITKVTVASSNVKPDKRIRTSQNTTLKRTAIKEPTSEDVSPKFAEKIITTLARDEEPATIDEVIVRSINETEEKDGISIEEREGREEPNEEDEMNKIERSKGGGEQRTRIYRQIMHATQQGDTTTNSEESPRHTVATQVSATLIGKTNPKPFLHLKSNKVDPIKNASASDKRNASETSRMDECVESLNPIEHSVNDGCSFYRRQKNLTPTSDNFRCYTVFKDRKGTYFCEFCAPLDSKKITCRLEMTDMKKLRCANCRFNFREQNVKTDVKLKPDICPKCDQSRRHATPPSPI